MLPLWVNRTNQCSVLGLKRAKEKEKMDGEEERERERLRTCSYLKKNCPKTRKKKLLSALAFLKGALKVCPK
jgi:hypothetical protein